MHVYRRDDGGWTLDEQVSPAGSDLMHPSLSFDRRDRLHVAWLDNGAGAIRYARRDPDGSWPVEDETAAGGDVLAATPIDQSPSLAVDASDQPVVLFLSGSDLVRVRTRVLGGWQSGDPSPGVFAHSPGVYLRGNDRFALLGHDTDLHPAYLSRPADAGSWSGSAVFQPTGAYDGSANARFDPLYETDCNVMDAVFFDEDRDDDGSFKPWLYYASVRLPSISCSGVARNPPRAPGRPADTVVHADTTAPILSRASLSRRSWRRGNRRVRLRFRLSEPSRLTLAIGRKPVILFHGRRGRNSVAFSSRRAVRRLRAGRYRLRLRAADAAGNRSRRATTRFKVLRRH